MALFFSGKIEGIEAEGDWEDLERTSDGEKFLISVSHSSVTKRFGVIFKITLIYNKIILVCSKIK